MRIAGTNIPDNKRLEIALGYLYGIGDSLARDILIKAKISFDKEKAKDLSESEQMPSEIWLESIKLRGFCAGEIASTIKRLKEIKSYRGTRHSKKLPSRDRGQKPIPEH